MLIIRGVHRLSGVAPSYVRLIFEYVREIILTVCSVEWVSTYMYMYMYV